MSATSTFGETYASFYDEIYRSKDYKVECDVIESIAKQFVAGDIVSVLDLGCGTGGHSVELSDRGHDVVGIDASESMLARARLRRPEAKTLTFVQSDIEHLAVDRQFDCVIAMFSVLGYAADARALVRMLASARKHCRVGGVFICDVWSGLNVAARPPEESVATIRDAGRTLTRVGSPTLDLANQRCNVFYRLTVVDQAGQVAQETEEHSVRFFFPEEMRLALSMSGFQLLHLTEFPSLERPLALESRSMLIAACAVVEL